MDEDIQRLRQSGNTRRYTRRFKGCIETFFETTKMIKEGYVEKISEYASNRVLDRYPEWKKLVS